MLMVTSPKKPQLKFDLTLILGRQVRKLRAEAGFSQEMLAAQSGIFRTYLSRIESGSANPTITVVEALAAALKVNIRELFNE
jgi:transcriptional regulator with XRE-family HTH domain